MHNLNCDIRIELYQTMSKRNAPLPELNIELANLIFEIERPVVHDYLREGDTYLVMDATKDGHVYVGRITGITDKKITLYTTTTGGTKSIPKKDITDNLYVFYDYPPSDLVMAIWQTPVKTQNSIIKTMQKATFERRKYALFARLANPYDSI
jgi:hypothetical protein